MAFIAFIAAMAFIAFIALAIFTEEAEGQVAQAECAVQLVMEDLREVLPQIKSCVKI